MTCGGIIFIILLFIGGAWLSDQVNSSWPLYVAGAIFILLVAWRIFEFAHQRNEQRRLYRQLDWAVDHPEEFQAARDAVEGVTFRRKVAVSDEQEASFVRQRFDGVEQWRIYFDIDDREPTEAEMKRASKIVRNLNDELGLPNPPAKSGD